MQQGICNPEFYGELVYKSKKIIENPNFSDLFKRIVNHFKRAGYTITQTCPCNIQQFLKTIKIIILDEIF